MTVLVRSWPFALVVTGLLGGEIAAQPQSDGIIPYRATYAILDGNERVGQSVFTLSYNSASGQYTFESQSQFRGWRKLAAPRPVVERSEFVIADDHIRPIAFAYEDGTRRGKRDITLKFHWDSRTMTIERREGVSDVPIEPGTLDRGSVRAALMRDLAHAYREGSHVLVDPDVVRAYDYVIESTENIETALGEVSAYRIRQQRDKSSRHTLIWTAPSHDFVTLRMEQHREDRDPIAFVIESIEWLAENASTDRD